MTLWRKVFANLTNFQKSNDCYRIKKEIKDSNSDQEF